MRDIPEAEQRSSKQPGGCGKRGTCDSMKAGIEKGKGEREKRGGRNAEQREREREAAVSHAGTWALDKTSTALVALARGSVSL